MTELEQHLKENPWIEAWAKSMAAAILEENKLELETKINNQDEPKGI